MNHYEHQQQKALFDWARRQQIIYPQLKWMHSIPNAARRSPAQGKWMKDEGLKKGVWDIHLLEPVQKYHGLWIEMKSPGKKLTPEQNEFMEDNKHLFAFIICYDWIEARDGIILYLAGERF